MENKLFNDFDELLSGIDRFKENIQMSNKLLDTLNDLIAKIDTSKNSLDDNYDSFLHEIKTANANLNSQSEMVAQKCLEVITEQKKEFDNKYESFLHEISQVNINVTTQSDNVILKYIEVNRQQQDIFEKNVNGIIENLNNLRVESLLKEIKKVNTKSFYLMGGVTIAIILGVLSLFI